MSYFEPERLKHFFDEPGTKPVSREGSMNFRDELIRLLRKLRIKTITGTITVSNLAVGESVDVSVDHTSSARFCFADYPQFTPVNGVEVLVFAMLDISGTSYSTSGSGYVIRVTNASLSAYSPSFSLSWSRRGRV